MTVRTQEKIDHILRRKETDTSSCRTTKSIKRKLHCKNSLIEVKVTAQGRTS